MCLSVTICRSQVADNGQRQAIIASPSTVRCHVIFNIIDFLSISIANLQSGVRQLVVQLFVVCHGGDEKLACDLFVITNEAPKCDRWATDRTNNLRINRS